MEVFTNNPYMEDHMPDGQEALDRQELPETASELEGIVSDGQDNHDCQEPAETETPNAFLLSRRNHPRRNEPPGKRRKRQRKRLRNWIMPLRACQLRTTAWTLVMVPPVMKRTNLSLWVWPGKRLWSRTWPIRYWRRMKSARY